MAIETVEEMLKVLLKGRKEISESEYRDIYAFIDRSAAAELDKPEPESRRTALHIAAYNGNLEVVEALVRAGANINKTDANGDTPLICAAMNNYSEEGAAEILDFLVNEGANLDAKSSNGLTAIYAAVHRNDLYSVKVLVEKKAQLDQPAGDEGKTPLYRAVQRATIKGLDAKVNETDYKIVEALVEAGADVNQPTSDGRTPLDRAADNGDLRIVKVLLTKGAKADKPTSDGTTPIWKAMYHDYADVLHALLLALPKDHSRLPSTTLRDIKLTMKQGLVDQPLKPELELEPRQRGLVTLALLAAKIESLPTAEGQQPFQYPISEKTPSKVVELLNVIAPRTATPELSVDTSERLRILRDLRSNLVRVFSDGEDKNLAAELNANRAIATLFDHDFSPDVEFSYLKEEKQSAVKTEIQKALDSLRQLFPAPLESAGAGSNPASTSSDETTQYYPDSLAESNNGSRASVNGSQASVNLSAASSDSFTSAAPAPAPRRTYYSASAIHNKVVPDTSRSQ